MTYGTLIPLVVPLIQLQDNLFHPIIEVKVELNLGYSQRN